MTELVIEPEVYEEILRNTDRPNYMRFEERIARKSLVQLVKSGHATFMFIHDDEAREYWSRIVKNAASKVKARREAKMRYEVKMNVWNRLSEADRKALKIRKPTAPKD